MDDIEKHKNWLKVLALADEALKRKLAAAKALDIGWGGSRLSQESPACPHNDKKRNPRT